ncbi:MAG TPA: hypothetical protein VEU08_18035, partial [Vicinamibacterales bacterium]|nr:hypothetical protein [Vicinamibacterales bacterium]
GEPVSTASDVYALGVVLYQLLTGRLPYGTEQRSSSAALADAITTHDADRPSAVATAFARELRGDLDAIVLKALRKEPDKRYASVDHFADDIRRHLDGRPVLARRGTWTYLASRFTRRHRAAVAAAVLVFVTLVTGIVVTAREARVAEANRRRADARFNDVRKLANSLLFEVHDSIANLPGATDARQLILRRSLEYLDSLAKESTNEPDLMRELATAYDRVGTLEGDGTTSNLGRVDAARASREKAVSLREALARDNPGNPQDQVGLGVAYDQYASFELASVGDVVSALAFARRAVAILDREAAAAPRDMAIVDALLRALTDLVWIEVGEGLNGRAGRAEDAVADAQRTLSLSSRAIGLVPSNEGLQFRHANAQLTLGDAFLKAGRRPEALNAYKQADTLLRRLAERGNNSRALINQSALNSKIGDLLLIDGNAAAAVDYYRTGVDETDALAAADPHNDFILQHQVTTHVELGHALVEMGHTLQGVAYMRDALGRIAGLQTAATPLVRSTEMLVRGWLGEGLERQGDVRGAREQYAASKASLNVVRASNASSRVTEYYAMTTDRLGSALVALGDIDQASREFEESRQLLEPLVRSDPEDYELAYTLADTYTRQGLVAAKRAERTTDRALKVLQWQTARERFRESLAVWKNVPNPARISTSGLEVATPDAVLGHLARAEHEIAAFSR